MLRKQMPACTPIGWRAVAAATAALADRGDRTKADGFETVRALLAAHFSARTVLLTDTGTGALQIALRAAGARAPGAPVALPAYCCYDVATAAVGAGVPVLFYDLDSRTLSPDLASIDDVLRRGARAVVVAHLFGLPDVLRFTVCRPGCLFSTWAKHCTMRRGRQDRCHPPPHAR
jgi:dTDP-4-amino-4,6-dideoxygalactose transaminase